MNPVDNVGTRHKTTVNINSFKKRHFQIVKLINSLYKNKEIIKVAEIGSGYGHLANLISIKSKNMAYTGYELNPGRAEFCRQNNLNVKDEYFPVKPNAYNVVILDNVLEHIVDPGNMLNSVAKSLKQDGYILIIVPNRHDIRRLSTRWRNRHFWQLRSHVSYYSYGDLVRLTQRYGLKIKVFGFNSFIWSVGSFIKIILDLIGIRISGLYVYASKGT